MGLIKEYLGSITGVQFYAIIAMVLFILTFLFMLLFAFSYKKDEIKKFSHLPLEDEDVESQ
jgi:hypothetical protein